MKPSLRWYDQTAADFYAVRFSGAPQHYSADYRVSAFRAVSYGLKLVWRLNPALGLDVAYERYEQQGTDGETDAGVYPRANIFTAGARIDF